MAAKITAWKLPDAMYVVCCPCTRLHIRGENAYNRSKTREAICVIDYTIILLKY